MAPSRENTIADIKQKTKEFLASKEKSNNIIDILEYIENDEPGIVIAAIKSIHKICISLLSTNQIYDGTSESKPDKKMTASNKYKLWLFERYTDCIQKLVKAMDHSSSNVQELALCTLMKFVETQSRHPVKKLQHGLYFPQSLFSKILDGLLSSDIVRHQLIGRFQEYLEYDDIRYYLLDKISVRAAYIKKHKSSEDNKFIVENLFTLLEQISRCMPGDGDEHLDHFLTKLSEDSDSHNAASPKEHKRVFDNAWLAFLQLPLPTSIYKKVLLIMHEHVIPHMRSPLLLIDFLTVSYNIGGAISLLALNGLFILIHKHNLEYPDFYKKLYALLEPSIFHVKYRARFFYLTDLFLMSTYIPSYLVAAFVKKLSRLSLTAPPTGSLLVIPLVCNLIKRHPNLSVLINRQDGPTELTDDPYNMEESDPVKCHAMDSSLWELKTLQSHYYHEVVTSASRINRAFPKEEWEIGNLLELTQSELVDKEVKKKMRKVPLEFEVPVGLFGGKNDRMNDMWTL
ncbi:nucleolar complex protein 4 homolog B-like [Glandiceps talaboti]